MGARVVLRDVSRGVRKAVVVERVDDVEIDPRDEDECTAFLRVLAKQNRRRPVDCEIEVTPRRGGSQRYRVPG
ncbi:MAG: hypothetical protein ACRCYU_09745 [Nocardioides sp.]